MKKYFLLIISIFTLMACEENVSFNNPSFQGLKDNVFWRAVQTKASLQDDGSLTIKAYSGNEVVTFKTTSKLPQTYFLGTSDSNTATYVLTDKDETITFATGLDVGDGQIMITEYDEINNTVSGTFKFNAENLNDNPLAEAVLNFQQGVFYKIPISNQ